MLAFLAGFLVCYAVGVVLCFNLMMVGQIVYQDAVPRSLLWMQQANGAVGVMKKLIDEHGKICWP